MNRDKITVRLGSVRRYRNEAEYRTVQRASIGETEVVGDGYIVRDILKLAHAQGASIEATVEVFRGETLCFKPMPLKSWIFPPLRRKQVAA